MAALVVSLSTVLACNPAQVSPNPASAGPTQAASGGPPVPDGSGSPPIVGGSSQALIAADLESGAIDLGTALTYRVWTLFWDPRLPERYDGTGSTGEDLSLFTDIEDALPGLPAEQRAALEGYLLRPTDPASPFGAGQTAAVRYAALTALDESEPARCSIPRRWISSDWSPDGSADSGFRAWVCAPSDAEARPALDRALAVGAALWPRMTAAEPDGMGPPMPDTTARSNDGNGKIDVYVLDVQQCRMRGLACVPIPGDAIAAATMGHPKTCGAPAFPSAGCSGYMLVGRDRIEGADFVSDFAHEFFHVLQYTHNGLKATWYHEASAVWAEWHYERELAEPGAYGHYSKYQEANHSLLWFDPSSLYQYQAWGWPLYQETKLGPSGVFLSWRGIEGAANATELDSALDAELSFGEEFRDFAVRNAQPPSYLPPDSTGLEDESWQKVQRPSLASFPVIDHKASVLRAIGIGKSTASAEIDPLTAQYDVFDVTDTAVRQLTIDIGGLKGASDADLDVLGRLNPVPDGPKDPWRRERASGGKLTICRDDPEQNYNLLHVVISNHAVARDGNLPDFKRTVKGDYRIEATDKCDVPDHYDVTFSGSDVRSQTSDKWQGTATFDRKPQDPRNFCSAGSYCYGFASGNATWTCDGQTVTLALSPAAGDDGDLTLTVTDPDRPELNRTYRGILSFGDHPTPSGCASFGPIAWINISGHTPYSIGPGWGLSGTYSPTGCGDNGCGSQSWTWEFRPRFDN